MRTTVAGQPGVPCGVQLQAQEQKKEKYVKADETIERVRVRQPSAHARAQLCARSVIGCNKWGKWTPYM